jgi:hypothetical protein
MLQSTLNLVREVLKNDSTLTPADRNKIVARMRNGEGQPAPVQTAERILTRAEVAKRLSRSLRLVDRLSQSGALRRITLPGRQRSAGFLERDVVALIAGSVSLQE